MLPLVIYLTFTLRCLTNDVLSAGEAEAVKQAEQVAARVAATASAGKGCGMHSAAHAACCPRSEMSAWLTAGCISSRRLLSIVTARLQDSQGKPGCMMF